MEEKAFKIYVDRLRHGEVNEISITTPPTFLHVNEPELRFRYPVSINGRAYLAESDLILNLHIQSEAEMPCSICNEWTSFPIDIQNFYLTKPVSEISSHIFDFSEDVREVILLEVPFVVECSGGKCPSRKEIEEYLAPPTDEDNDGWQPFKDL